MNNNININIDTITINVDASVPKNNESNADLLALLSSLGLGGGLVERDNEVSWSDEEAEEENTTGSVFDTQQERGPTYAEVQAYAQAGAGPTLDVDAEDSTVSVEPEAAPYQSDAMVNEAAYGSEGKNAAKLQWALRRVVDVSDDALVSFADLPSGAAYAELYELPASLGQHSTCYVNLYREAGGFAKLGSVRHASEHRARSTASPSNLVAVVGLSDTRVK